MTIIGIILLVIIVFLVSPWVVYMWSYMSARGKWSGVHDAKINSSVKNFLNLKKYGKEQS